KIDASLSLCHRRKREITKADGTRTTTFPTGMLTTLVPGPDFRFGMQASVSMSLQTTTSGGLRSTITATRTVTLADPHDPLSLESDACHRHGHRQWAPLHQHLRCGLAADYGHHPRGTAAPHHPGRSGPYGAGAT